MYLCIINLNIMYLQMSYREVLMLVLLSQMVLVYTRTIVKRSPDRLGELDAFRGKYDCIQKHSAVGEKMAYLRQMTFSITSALSIRTYAGASLIHVVTPTINSDCLVRYEPRCEKTGLRGFRPGPTQTRLYSHTRWLEA